MLQCVSDDDDDGVKKNDVDKVVVLLCYVLELSGDITV